MLEAERRRKEGRKEAMPSAREGNQTKDESDGGRAAGARGGGQAQIGLDSGSQALSSQTSILPLYYGSLSHWDEVMG